MVTPLAKSGRIPLGLTAAASATNAGIHKRILGSVTTTVLIISNEKMREIMKIVKSLRALGLLIKSVNQTIENQRRKERIGFLGMGNMLESSEVIRVGNRVIRAGNF